MPSRGRPARPTRLRVEGLEDRAVPAAGDPDLGFAQGGVLRVDGAAQTFGDADDFEIRKLAGRDAALLANGDFVVAGGTGFTYGEYFLDRFNRPIYRETVFGGTTQGGPNLNTAADTRAFAVARFTNRGGPITTGDYGADGVAEIDIDATGDEARAVTLQPGPTPDRNGRPDFGNPSLIVAGVTNLPVMRGNPEGFPNDFGPQNGPRVGVVTRVDPGTGQLDASFGENQDGIQRIRFDEAGNPAGYSAAISDVAVQPADRKVVVVSELQSNPDQNYGTVAPRIGFQVARLNADGTPDPTFGPNGTGRVFVDFPGLPLARFTLNDQRPARVIIQANGQIVLAGCVAELGGALLVARLDPNGALDPTFGAGGVARFNAVPVAGGEPSSVGGVAIVDDPDVAGDERLLVSGGDGKDFFAAKVVLSAPAGSPLAPGQLDPTFGANGSGIARLAIDTGEGNKVDAATGIGVEDTTGKIVLGGRANLAPNVNGFAAARLLANGSPDPLFNGGRGRVYSRQVGTGTGFGTAASNANTFVIGGKTLLVGSQDTANGKFLDGRPRPNNTNLVALQLQTDTDFNPFPIPPDPPNPATDVVGFRFAATGAAGRVAAVPVNKDLQVNPAAVADLAVIPTALPFDGVYQVATGDVDGDNQDDFIVATGPGAAARFAVVSGVDRTTLLIPPTPVFAGSEGFTGGAFVSAGDVDGDGADEMVFTPDVGGGPRVTVYSLIGGRLNTRANFFGIADPAFRGGARSAVGDVNGDGKADLLVAAGAGGGPRVALYSGATLFSANRLRLVNDFFAFDPALRDGVFAAIGDLTGDGKAEVVFGAGSGGAPRVLVVSGTGLLANGPTTALANPVANFFVGGDDTARGGARVAAVDLDQDGQLDLAVGQGGSTRVRVYYGTSVGGGEPSVFQDLDPFGTDPLGSGVFVG